MADAVVTPRAILAFLTGPRGAFSLVPTATAWLLKDIGFVFVAGSLLLLDQELTLDLCDLVFRCLSCFVSAALLASLLDGKPRVFEACYWAHMGCVPIDLALAVAFVLFKEDMVEYEARQALVASGGTTLAARGLELNATLVDGTDAPDASGAGRVAVRAAGRAGVSPLLSAVWQLVRLRRSGGAEQVIQQAGIKAVDLQNPLTVFLVVDHAVCVFARSHLVWRINQCLHALVRNQVMLGATAGGAAAAAADLGAVADDGAPYAELADPVASASGDAPEEVSNASDGEKQRRPPLRGADDDDDDDAIARQQRDLLDVMRTTSSSSSILIAPRRKR
ncbi:uncharacterized protein LOC142583648 [Dermacentor variabilis]|uniref:uncharacterized protein LOC142583648 n=1 Tax=Dermacentor variabilis TaxID=34621 RepID=UPI003F5B5EB9